MGFFCELCRKTCHGCSLRVKPGLDDIDRILRELAANGLSLPFGYDMLRENPRICGWHVPEEYKLRGRKRSYDPGSMAVDHEEVLENGKATPPNSSASSVPVSKPKSPTRLANSNPSTSMAASPQVPQCSDEEDAEALFDETCDDKLEAVEKQNEKNEKDEKDAPTKDVAETSKTYGSDEEDAEALFDDFTDAKSEVKTDSKNTSIVDGQVKKNENGDEKAQDVVPTPVRPAKPKKVYHPKKPANEQKEGIPLETMVCQLCGKRLSHKRTGHDIVYALIQHSVSHIDIKPFQCSECDFTAHRSVSIPLHRRAQHNGVGSVIDNRTNVYFAKLKLQAMRNFPLQMHEVEKYMDAQMARFNDGLSIHLDEEREVEKNQCQLCGKKITLQKDPCINTICIMQHSMTHIDHRPFRCPQCNVDNRAKDEIRKHQVRMHGHAEEVIDGRTEEYFTDLINMARTNFPLQVDELETRIEFVKSKLREFGPIKAKADRPYKASDKTPADKTAQKTEDSASPVKRRRSQRPRNDNALQAFYREFGLGDISPKPSTSRGRGRKQHREEERDQEKPVEQPEDVQEKSAEPAEPAASPQAPSPKKSRLTEIFGDLVAAAGSSNDGDGAPPEFESTVDDEPARIDALMALFGHPPT
ncbi:unnamed protein product, partial [Mesorhabditis spiculigera]